MVRTIKPDAQAIAEDEHKQLIKPIRALVPLQEERTAKLTVDFQERAVSAATVCKYPDSLDLTSI
jgi:hypothetical protein